MIKTTREPMQNDWLDIQVGDCRERMAEMPEQSFQACVTSPPYFGLRAYGDGSQDAEIGGEATPDEFVAAMVDVFRSVWRVLRDDGCLFLNLGDSYAAHPNQRKTTDNCGPKQDSNRGSSSAPSRSAPGFKPKDLMGIPWRVALALQADGWYLRSDIIWSKSNGMPESVDDRPTKSHEYVFMLTKSQRYFYDKYAAQSPYKPDSVSRGKRGRSGSHKFVGGGPGEQSIATDMSKAADGSGANLRSVWRMATAQCKNEHFAVMPTDLAITCIQLSTSERGACPECGAAWERVVETVASKSERLERLDCPQSHHPGQTPHRAGNYKPQAKTTGWTPGCECVKRIVDVEANGQSIRAGQAFDPVPCRILDPFGGAATTALAARELGLHCTLIELYPEYAAMGWQRATAPKPADVPTVKSMAGQQELFA